MLNNKKAVIQFTPIIGVIIIFIVLLIAVAGQKGNGNGVVDEKRTIECDVTIHQPVFQQDKIKALSCDVTEGCSWVDSQRLGIFSEEGNVRLIDSKGVIDKKPYKLKTIIQEQDTVTLRGCTKDDEVKIRLTDEEDNLLDEKLWVVK